MSESSNPARHNQAVTMPEGRVSRYMDRVIGELQSRSLTETQHARVLGDHLIGAILRAQGARKASQTIAAISQQFGHQVNPVPEVGSSTGAVEEITRRRGIYRAVLTVAPEPENSRILASLNEYLHSEEAKPGVVTMTTMDQMAAYIGMVTPSEAKLGIYERRSPWKQRIAEEVAACIQDPDRPASWDVVVNNIPAQLEAQTEWQRSADIAQTALLDMDLIVRSAEYIRQQQIVGQSAGRIAVLSLIPPSA